MPDLNLKNPLTLKYLIQNAGGLNHVIWIRVDTYNYSDPKELQLGPNLSPMNIPILIL
jgi:hypothetical protein